MTSWWSAAPELLLATLWFFVPGTALAWAMRARGLTAVLAAPAVSVGMLAGWGVVLGEVGIRWSALTAAVAVVLTVALAYAIRRAVDARRATSEGGRVPGPTSRPPRLTAALTMAGAVTGALFAAVPVARAMGRPDLPAQFWDVVFHLNATRYVLDSGSASSLTLGRVNDQVATGNAFYPAGWHTVTSLATTDSVVVSSNAVVLVTVSAVWAFGVAAFARAVLPGNRYLGFFAPLAGAAMLSFPNSFTVGGGIWPNLLSVALIPATLACGVVVLRHTEPDRLGWAVLAAGALGGVALAHPSGLLTFASVITPLVIARAFGVVRDAARRPDRPRVRRVLPAAAAVAGVVVWGVFWSILWRVFASQVADDKWRGTNGFWHGVRWALLDSPDLQVDGSHLVRGIALGLLGLGVLIALVTRGARWLVPASGALLVLAGLSEADNSLLWVVMPWFSGPNRLYGNVPIVTSLLTGIGLTGLAVALTWLVRKFPARAAAWERNPTAIATVCALVVAIGHIGATGGLRADEHQHLNEAPYQGMLGLADGNIADAHELAMIERLRGQLEPGGVMIGDPFRGFGLAYAISDVPVLFPHLGGRWSPDARFLALHLAEIHENPEVCAAIDRLGVRYLYTDTIVYLPWHGGRLDFAGIPEDPPQPGFELVDQGGQAKVWRITACD